MKTITKTFLFAALSAGISTSTFAAKDGFYMGGQLGYADTNYSASNQHLKNATVIINGETSLAPLGTANTSTDEDNFGGRFFVGYQFNKYFALESGFTDFGETKVNNIYGISDSQVDNSRAVNKNDVTLSEDAFDVVAKGMIPLGKKFDLYGKAGVAYVIADTVSDPATLTATVRPFDLNASYSFKTDTEKRLLPTAAVGAEYSITEHLSTDLSYSIIPGRDNIETAQLISAGLAWHF